MHCARPGGPAERRHSAAVPAEGRDVFLDPLQGRSNVLEAGIAGNLLRVRADKPCEATYNVTLKKEE